jgi:hypothetical protein
VVLGGLIVVGLVWSVPWPTLLSLNLDDAPSSEALQNQPEQASAEDQPEQANNEGSTGDHPDQGSTGEQSKEEKAPQVTPSKEEVASNDLQASSSSSPPAQVSLPPQAPSPTPSMQQVQMTSPSPNDYWYPESDYRYFEPGYWDYSWEYYGSDNYYQDY